MKYTPRDYGYKYHYNVLNLGEGCLQENQECMEISLENNHNYNKMSNLIGYQLP